MAAQTGDELLASRSGIVGKITVQDILDLPGSSSLVEIACKNTSGGTITVGTPVYKTGTVGASNTIEIAPADALISLGNYPAVGLLKTTLLHNEIGSIVVTGELTNIITSPIDGAIPITGDTIYLKSGGGLTLTKPTGAGNAIQNMGIVGKVSTGTSGSVTVSSIMRANDVPNLPEGRIWVGDGNTLVSNTVFVDEPNLRLGIGTTTPSEKLEVNGNIKLSETAATTDLDKFAVLDNGVLKYRTGSEVLSDIGAQVSLTNPVTGTGTTNYVSKWTGSNTQGNSQIFDNGTNVGIGTTAPSEALDVVGAITLNDGNNNTKVGTNAGSGYSGTNQSALGYYAGRNNTGGNQSSFGYTAGQNNTGGNQSAFGVSAGYGNTGNDQSSFGLSAGNSNTGVNQSVFGYGAGQTNTGANQSAFGNFAGRSNTGDNNSNFGYLSGYFLSNGTTVNTGSSESVFLGSNTKALGASQANQIVIGHDATGIGANSVVLGNSSVTKTQLRGNVLIDDAIISKQENTDVDTGTEVIAEVSSTTYTAAFFDYVIKNGSNLRAGTISACHDGSSNVEYNEVSTNDLGDTSDVTLSVDISGGNIRLRATTTSDNWSIKSLVRGL